MLRLVSVLAAAAAAWTAEVAAFAAADYWSNSAAAVAAAATDLVETCRTCFAAPYSVAAVAVGADMETMSWTRIVHVLESPREASEQYQGSRHRHCH